MPEITESQLKKAYELSKKFHAGEINKDVAIAELASAGMNEASAADYVSGVQRLLSGEAYQRTMSTLATRIFMEGIRRDFGDEAAATAAAAVRGHLEYYSQFSPQKEIRNFIDQYDPEKLIAEKTKLADGFNAYVNLLNTQFMAKAYEGRYIEFWSGRSRSDSHFVIGYDHLATAIEVIKNLAGASAAYSRYVERTWRDMHSHHAGNPVFQALLTTQTKNISTLIAKIVSWANDLPANNYRDDLIPLEHGHLQKALEYLKELNNEDHLRSDQPVVLVRAAGERARSTLPASAGVNMIVYGAPGSGKSHFVDGIASDEDIRTVFHPEYQNADFVGNVRPSMNGENVIYSYAPGPFIQALLKAVRQPDEQVHLVIEEINRANASAVFGDIFQLLDRQSDRTSQYSISTDAALKSYLEKEKYTTPDRLSLPANLSIFATMNSSDQGVFPLDAAFKRRWQFHYCPIDFIKFASKPSFADKLIPYEGSLYSWTAFAEAVNSLLKACSVEEDRLIGPFFLSEQERENSDTCLEAITGKLLIYLWDDVLRHGLRHEVFRKNFATFSDLSEGFKRGMAVFSPAFVVELQKFSPVEVNLSDSQNT